MKLPSSTRKLTRIVGSPLRVLGVTILIGAIAFGSIQFRDLRDHDQREQARQDVLTLAGQQVLDLTTLDSTNVAARIRTMQARSEGTFKTQLSALAATFSSVIKKGAVRSTGAVNAKAVVLLSATRAEVIVASTAQVSDGKTQSEARTYRFAVDLVLKNGDWLISGMEFVA